MAVTVMAEKESTDATTSGHAFDVDEPRRAPLPLLWRLVRGAADSVLPKSATRERGVDYEDARDCRPPPLFILVVSCVELGVFIYYACALGKPVTSSGPIPIDSVLIYDPHRRREVWRLFSYMLIHAGWVHITTNLVFQLAIGIPLEMVHKLWRIAPVYLCGVIAGSLGTSIMDNTTYLAGASAGVYSLIAAHLANVIMNWGEMGRRKGCGGAIRLICIIIFVIIDVSVAIYNRYAVPPTPDAPKTGYTAHLAGAITGLLVGVVFLRNLEKKRWESALWWTAIALILALFAFAILWNIFNPTFPAQQV